MQPCRKHYFETLTNDKPCEKCGFTVVFKETTDDTKN